MAHDLRGFSETRQGQWDRVHGSLEAEHCLLTPLGQQSDQSGNNPEGHPPAIRFLP